MIMHNVEVMLIQERFTGHIVPWSLPSHSIEISSTVNIAITYCSMCMLLLGQLFIHEFKD